MRNISVPGIKTELKGNKVVLTCEKGNKKNGAVMGSIVSHIKNLFSGVEEKFVYELEICHVHFPMTVSVQKDKLIIDNFLGEKFKRNAKILSGVEVEVEGNKITVSGNELEATGQTAANIEKSVKVLNKDRRIFQDGIFITSKAGVKI